MDGNNQAMLKGINILDLTNFMFGPYATQTLADLGADVIKVEPPEGDILRQAGPSVSGEPMGSLYLSCNRNKRSIVLDMHVEKQRAALDRMIEWADVVIHNIRAEQMIKYRLSYEDVSAVKSDIVYVHCVGYGSAGPYAGRAAFDQLIQSATGTAYIFGQADGNPEPRMLPMLLADKTSALFCAYSIMAGIIHKLRTGEGQRIEVPMFECIAAYTLVDQLFGHTFDPPIGPIGYGSLLSKDIKPIRSKDGYIFVLPYTTRQWHAALEVVGKGDLASEPRFATIDSRLKHMDELAGYLLEAIPGRSTAEWVEAFDAAGVPAMPIIHIEDMLKDEHLNAVGMVERVEHPSEGPIWLAGQPVSFSAHESEQRHLPPQLGADTEDVLAEFGFSPDEAAEIMG